VYTVNMERNNKQPVQWLLDVSTALSIRRPWWLPDA